MSREIFFIQLSGHHLPEPKSVKELDPKPKVSPVVVACHHIVSLKPNEHGSLMLLSTGAVIQVSETPEVINKLGAAYGTMKIIRS